MSTELVGPAEIAQRLGVDRQTVAKWRQRATVGFPPPSSWISGRALWDWPVVERWARETGRLD